ncbi:Hypothetical predicted protein [Olea europaea subsp. europaea]|uniref:Uncharacterized protein n=2 Tax=Olea europaea subsp. europaea TaxID=158383 RepID=A0A8S0RC50_OLEEU|nr:Hypothetical predicted protein [Olea europaea subsp. europaea]
MANHYVGVQLSLHARYNEHDQLVLEFVMSSNHQASRKHHEFPALQSTKWRVVVLLMMHRGLLSDAYNGGWCSYWVRFFFLI